MNRNGADADCSGPLWRKRLFALAVSSSGNLVSVCVAGEFMLETRRSLNGMVAASVSSSVQSSVLALNRQYVAVHILSVRRAFCLLYKGAAEVISVEENLYQNYTFDDWLEASLLRSSLNMSDHPSEEDSDWIQSVNFTIQVPRVIRLLRYERLPRNAVKFNRRNIFLRDENCCQYCGHRYGSHRLSLDHVMPKSRGGPTNWENIVCCCLDCNVKKGGRTPHEAGMALMRIPRKPARNPLLFHHVNSRKYHIWRTFLGEGDLR